MTRVAHSASLVCWTIARWLTRGAVTSTKCAGYLARTAKPKHPPAGAPPLPQPSTPPAPVGEPLSARLLRLRRLASVRRVFFTKNKKSYLVLMHTKDSNERT